MSIVIYHESHYVGVLDMCDRINHFEKTTAFAKWLILPFFKNLSFFEYQVFFWAVFCIQQL